MNIKKLSISTVIIWIVSVAYGWLTCGWLFNWVYQLPPNIWKAPEEMNFVGMNLSTLLSSVIFVLVFAVFYNGIPGKGIKKGLVYGFLIWLVGGLSGMISMPLYMTIASTVVVYWIISHLVLLLITGAIVGSIYKK